MQRKIKKVLILTSLLLLITLCFNSITYAIENSDFKVDIAIVDVPDSWDEVDNLDMSGFIFEVQLPDGDTVVYDCSQIDFDIDYSNSAKKILNSDKLIIWIYSDDTITFIFTEYNNCSIGFVKNDFRYYNFKNDSQTITFTTDYEIANQELFDIDKDYQLKYDLRDKMNIRVENQGGFGLCWDFALTKALETTYTLKYETDLDLSEMYIDYMTNNGTGRGDRALHTGGNHYLYYNETIRSGICSEEELPYTAEEEYNINDVKNCTSLVLPQSAFLIDETEIRLNRNKEIINKMIKEQLLNNGAVTASIAFDQEYYDNDTYTFFLPTYCVQNNVTSHEVTIVGWDDTFPKESFKRHYVDYGVEADVEPKEDGAWIVLNSWGEEYGDNGIFYLSYESNIKNAFGFLDVVPYEERNEYTYVENEYKKLQPVNINENQKKYFYQEFNVNGDDENITHITIANAIRGKVYYIDNYKEKSEINFDDKIFIGDFATSTQPVSFSFLHLMEDFPLKTNFVLDEPIKVNGDKFLIIVEIDGNYVDKAFLNKTGNTKTYYTDNELSTSWNRCAGNLPIGVFTINRKGAAEAEQIEENNIEVIEEDQIEETASISPETGDNIILWVSLMIISVFGIVLTINIKDKM